MIEVREVDTARALLRTQVFMRVKQEEPDRFLKLEHLCGRTYLDIRCSLSMHVHSAFHLTAPCNASACFMLSMQAATTTSMELYS